MHGAADDKPLSRGHEDGHDDDEDVDDDETAGDSATDERDCSGDGPGIIESSALGGVSDRAGATTCRRGCGDMGGESMDDASTAFDASGLATALVVFLPRSALV